MALHISDSPLPEDRELDSLLSTLISSIDAFRHELREKGFPPPNARNPHPLDSGYLLSPKGFEAKRTILATLGALTNTFQTPFEKLSECTHRIAETASLQVVCNLGVPSAIQEFPLDESEEGVSIHDLASAVNVHPGKLISPMRLLSATGWFEELDEGVFRNTKMSLQLANGRDEWHWAKASEFSVVGASGLAQAVVKPEWRYSFSSLHTGCQIGHRTESHMFDLLRSDKERLHSFTKAVHALDARATPSIVHDYAWSRLPEGTTVVDVGGGNGGLAVALYKSHPSLRYIVQDRPDTVAHAKEHIRSALGSDYLHAQARLSSDATDTTEIADFAPPVSAMAHDFFTPQPLRGDGYTYIMKWVIHNWPDEECVKILSHIAEAAGPNSRILIIDNIVEPSTITPDSPANTGAEVAQELLELGNEDDYRPIPAPAYIPANYGQAGKFALTMSVMMQSQLNAAERSLKEFKAIFDRAGLELVHVHSLRSWISILELRKA